MSRFLQKVVDCFFKDATHTFLWLVSPFAVLIFGIIILRLLNVRHLLRQKTTLLELTPPAFIDKTLQATQYLFSVLHTLDETRHWLERFLGHKAVFSLEVVSTRDQGIRYVARVATTHRAAFEKEIAGYQAGIRVKETTDYLPIGMREKHVKVVDFKQTNHFAYPLQTEFLLDEADPTSYLTSTMTQLAPGEVVAFQIVASPADLRATQAIRQKILNNEHVLEHLESKHKQFFGVEKLFHIIRSLLFSITDAVGEAYHGRASQSHVLSSDTQHKAQAAKRLRPVRTLSAFELELVESIQRKIEQPLFRVNIRALVVANDKEVEIERASAIRHSLGLFTVPRYQSLKARYRLPYRQWSKHWLYLFERRLPALFDKSYCYLSTSELTSLYHFPHSETANIENVVRSLSKTLPAPISLKSNAPFNLILGNNIHHGAITPIGLTNAERERHIFIIGGTGGGKTTLMKYAIVQNIRNNEGVAVVDPHGDLAQELLAYIPERRINDVIYFNPDDLSYPIGLNVLELTPGLEGDELLREKDLVTEAVVSMFRKIFSENDSGGHRVEYVLRNAIQTALTIEGATLFTVYNLLNNPSYRNTILKTLDNEDLQNFWRNELGKAGSFQQVKMAAGITAKIGRFLFSASAKRVLEQPTSTINFGDILNGKILICNFSKGLLGEDTSELFGIAILAKLQMAALHRARIEQVERKPFYLYVDEFQNFATPSFVQMLSEARKYKLFLTMAEQSTSQQDDQKMVNIILANVGTIICFRTGNPADERLLLPLFSPHIQAGEIANLPSYNFYIRVSAVHAQEPFSGQTILLTDTGSAKVAKQVTLASRRHNAKRYVAPELNQEKLASTPMVRQEYKANQVKHRLKKPKSRD
ncbi:MAG TPA: type IV secretory system conjugative DNA transfer family protein [Candidatus Saccharimonadia bacterium]|nr:type IV secretory system conjugative DNA transfer family protein [Candidatus Saccharimonadia bacterium]